MGKGMRAALAFGVAGVAVLFTGTAAYAATVTANDDAGTTTAGQPVSIDVTANDSVESGGTNLTLGTPNSTANGTLSASGSTMTYTPNAGFTGSDAFEYELCATFPGEGEYGAGDQQVCDTATVTITVNADTGPLGPPVSPYGAGDPGGSGPQGTGAGTGSGGSLPTTGSGAWMLGFLGLALFAGGIACYGAGRDSTRAFVR
jgi:hypothetical protein